jgi:hypothetical protein
MNHVDPLPVCVGDDPLDGSDIGSRHFLALLVALVPTSAAALGLPSLVWPALVKHPRS